MANPRFDVIQLPNVRQEIEDLAIRAEEASLKGRFLSRLRAVAKRLYFEPWKVGEQLYRTRYPGGVVHKVAKPPFILYFALYKAERLVVIFRIEEFPLSFKH